MTRVRCAALISTSLMALAKKITGSNHQPFAPRVPPPQLLKVTPSTASAMPLHASAEGCSPKMRTVINTVRARLILLATVVGDMPIRCDARPIN
ncbi:MAG: hypothetical protein IPO60_09100 [Flavobacteriales bacterium]|nr:hypothetical protein [Flavobacteriales bacterium]